MPLDPAALDVLAIRCAPVVAPQTLRAVARVESGFEPLAIGVNGPSPYRLLPRTIAEATAQASRLVAQGVNVDLGLLQINSRNLDRVGLSVAGAFNPCLNLRAAARLLQNGYGRGNPNRVGEQAALRIALSYYNTGWPDRGFRNGYVARVTGSAADRVAKPAERSAAEPAAPPPWDVFAASSMTIVFVTAPSAQGVTW